MTAQIAGPVVQAPPMAAKPRLHRKKKRRRGKGRRDRQEKIERDFIGLILREPPPLPLPPQPEEPPELRFSKADARAILANPGATLDQLEHVVRPYPSHVLKHPALALYSLEEPDRWHELVKRANYVLWFNAWARISRRLTLTDYRKLTVAALRRCASTIDARITPPGFPHGTTETIAAFLESVVERRVSQKNARRIKLADLPGIPARAVSYTTSEDERGENREAQGCLKAAYQLIVGPPEATTKRLGRPRRVLHRGHWVYRHAGPKVTDRRYAPSLALGQILSFDSWAEGGSGALPGQRWQLEAAKALLRGKTIPL